MLEFITTAIVFHSRRAKYCASHKMYIHVVRWTRRSIFSMYRRALLAQIRQGSYIMQNVEILFSWNVMLIKGVDDETVRYEVCFYIWAMENSFIFNMHLLYFLFKFFHRYIKLLIIKYQFKVFHFLKTINSCGDDLKLWKIFFFRRRFNNFCNRYVYSS